VFKDFVVNVMRNTMNGFEYTEGVLRKLHQDSMAKIAVFSLILCCRSILSNWLLESEYER